MTLEIIDASSITSGRVVSNKKISLGDKEYCMIDGTDGIDINDNIREKICDTIKNVGIERLTSAHRIGYACVNMSIDATTNRTCRLDNCNDARLRELISSNLAGMKRIIEWNIKKGIMLYRISSAVIPYASHEVNKIAWWDEYKDKINEIGEIIRNSGMRVSMHPGQYVNINSPDSEVVFFSIKELEYHAKFMNLLGLNNNHRMILHIGGVYGNKMLSMKRFMDVFTWLSDDIKSRLIIENDDKSYNVWDVLDVSSKTGIPVVFDILHHQINHGCEEKDKDIKFILEQCFSTWNINIVRDTEIDIDVLKPKIHFSTQRPGAKYGVHADSVDMNLLMEIYCEFINYNFDIMLETKDKEMSVLKAMKILECAKNWK